MFGKTETRAALDVVMEINRDDTDRCCSFALTGATDAITIFVYPNKDNLDDSYGYVAYQTDNYISYERIRRNGITDSKKFNTFKELLEDVKGAAT